MVLPPLIISMTGSSDRYRSLPPTILRITSRLRWLGWVSFWVQIFLTCVSGIGLFFATTFNRTDTPNPGAGVGVAFAALGILCLLGGAYCAFSYVRLSRRLRQTNDDQRPRPKDVINSIRNGLVVNLTGMLVTLLGAEAIAGTLLGKAARQSPGGGFITSVAQYVEALDILVVLTNTHTILAHFVGVVVSLLLLRTVNR